MARYIGIEGAGIGKANREQFLVPEFADGWNAVLKILEKEPTADVAEVVRCRNCKHAYFRYNMKDTLQEIYACRKRPAGRSHKKVSGDFFCVRGERRTDNDL